MKIYFNVMSDSVLRMIKMTELIKRYPVELSSSQIAKLTGSTKNTVEAIRNGTFREAILEAKSPMDVGLCTYKDLEKALNRTRAKKDQ